MKKVAIIAGIVFLLFTIWFYIRNPLSPKVIIRDYTFSVDLAITPKDRERGLSGRGSLAQNSGVLFIHDAAALHGYWMRGMLFPLDFIWLRDKTVVELTKNVAAPAPGQAVVSLQPSIPVDMVLEVNAGTIDRRGILPGDKLTIAQ